MGKYIMIKIALLLAALIYSVSATSWTGGVITNTGEAWISRDSATVGFEMEGDVSGNIAAVEGPGGRILSPFHSYYADIDVNDARLRERTGALEGVYSADELISLRSETYNPVNQSIIKRSGSDVYTITWYEVWPVTLNASRSMEYTGTDISNRDFVGNNRDYAGMDFLYNKEFTKERTTALELKRMNFTVVGTDDEVISTIFMPTKSLDYNVVAHTTGLADLKYEQEDSWSNEITSGIETYMGTFDITKKIGMTSEYANTTSSADWMGCCFGGYDSMEAKDKKWIDFEFFNCTCFEIP